MKCVLFFILNLFIVNVSLAQVFGPNNPATGNTLGAGNNWTGPGNIFTSNNSFATISTAGNTRYLRGRNFGFGLLNTDIVQGIQLEVEKRGSGFNNVSLLNGWQDGELSTITNFPLSAGNNRMMVVLVGIENGSDQPIINSVTYGGQNLTRLSISSQTTGFWAHLEAWYLPQAQLALLAPGNYNINVNYGVFTQLEFFDMLSAAIFQNVDPIAPFIDVQNSQVSGGAPNPWQIPTAINVGVGGAAINGIFTGNNTTPASVNGATNCWTINSAFVEGTDRYRANTVVASTSGGCLQSAHKFTPAVGTEQPSTTFNGTSNRRVNIAFSLRRAEIVDNSVRLQKAGTTVGNDYAQTTAYWPLSDTYVSYGGAFDLWGTTWTFTDINNPNFAGIISAVLYNGVASVDHMRMTVYTTSILPVELIDFFAHEISSREVECSWITATEINSDYFSVERSEDGMNFSSIAETAAAGNSSELTNYNFIDLYPLVGVSYYRLKTVDLDGSFVYSDIKSVNRNKNDENLIYPNPASDWATIKANHDKYKLMIVASDGRVIDSSKSHEFGNSYRFNVQNEPDGTYYLILEDESEKIIKKFQKLSKGK